MFGATWIILENVCWVKFCAEINYSVSFEGGQMKCITIFAFLDSTEFIVGN